MANPDDGKITSTQKSLSSFHDPGWNDPPKWASNTSQTCTTPTKRLLNKRVAYPLNFQNANPMKCQSSAFLPSNLPPPVSSGELNFSTKTSNKLNSNESESILSINKEEILKETLHNLRIAIDKYVEETRIPEVQKRMEIMESLWMEDKLDEFIHKKLLDISRALSEEEDVEKADKIHISLMMERASLCSSWIPGIRRIIGEMKSRVRKFDRETESDLGPSLIPTQFLK